MNNNPKLIRKQLKNKKLYYKGFIFFQPYTFST